MEQMRTEQAGAAQGPSEADVQALLAELGVSPESNLIGVLQEVQAEYGYLPPAALEAISERTRIPLSRVYGVVTFYTQFYTEPRGRHTILCCRGTACHVRGAGRVLGAVERALGIKEGETTGDLMFYLEAVACLGTCFLAPVMMVDDLYFGKLTPPRIQSILRRYGLKK